MTQEDIIRMAREADIDWHRHWNDDESNRLEAFAALVATAEREACAKVCEEMSGPIEIYNPKYVHYIGCASAIRARGNT
jgi:hypothetical protein